LQLRITSAAIGTTLRKAPGKRSRHGIGHVQPFQGHFRAIFRHCHEPGAPPAQTRETRFGWSTSLTKQIRRKQRPQTFFMAVNVASNGSAGSDRTKPDCTSCQPGGAFGEDRTCEVEAANNLVRLAGMRHSSSCISYELSIISLILSRHSRTHMMHTSKASAPASCSTTPPPCWRLTLPSG